jgi:hypothetical protein
MADSLRHFREQFVARETRPLPRLLHLSLRESSSASRSAAPTRKGWQHRYVVGQIRHRLAVRLDGHERPGDRGRDASSTLATAKLLRACGDDPGAPLTITGVSAASGQGGTVQLAGGTITHTPASGFAGTDTFTCTVTEAVSLSTPGTVTVTVTAGSGPNILGITADATTVTVRLAGIPGQLYQIQA